MSLLGMCVLVEAWIKVIILTITIIWLECLLCTGHDVRVLYPLTLLILTPASGLGTLITTILHMLNLRYREAQ